MTLTLLSFARPYIPDDCRMIISEFMPAIIYDRCHVCGLTVIMKDKRGRLHFDAHIVCTEHLIVCVDCFEAFYA